MTGPRETIQDGPRVTPRDLEIVELIRLGHDTAGIAEELDISRWTVKRHVRKLCGMFGCPMIGLPVAVDRAV